MYLTILGTDSPFPHKGRATLGYLVGQGDTALLLESGCGISRRLVEEGLLHRISAVVLSHLHYDHCADLPAVVLGATLGSGRAEPLPVYLPPGESERLRQWLDACGFDFVLDYLTLQELVYGRAVMIGDLRITMHPARHGLPGGIIAAEADGKRLVYSGDTGDCPSLREALRDADLALLEVSALPAEQASAKGHLPASELGALAAAAGARQLVLTHLSFGTDPDAVAAVVARDFGRPVSVANEGDVFHL